MEDLRLVGVSDDGSRLVVQAPGGDRFGLVLDERLHAALRGDRARLGQLQIAIDHELRPREIQARIRAGEAAQEIAASAGLPVDRVARYEGPVLLERTVVAQTAQTVGVRRVTDSQTTPLGDLVRARLEDHQVAEDSLDWDSWLAPDGRWVVRLAYRAGEHDRSASWLYDARRRTVEPIDEEARWLSDEERAAPPRPSSRRTPRLAAVPADEPPAEAGRHDTVPISAGRGPRRVTQLPPGVQADVDDAPVQTHGQAAKPIDIAARGHDADGAADQDPDPDAEISESATQRTAGTTAGSSAAPRPTRAVGKGRPSKRASVPSWDEILFGAPKRDHD